MAEISLDKLSRKKKSSTIEINDFLGLIFICGGPTTQINEVNFVEECILIHLTLKNIGGGKNPILVLKISEKLFNTFPDTIKSFIRDFIKFYETLERLVNQRQCFIIGVVINTIFFDSFTLKKIIKKLVTFNYFLEIAQIFFKKYFVLSYIFFLCRPKFNTLYI